MLLTGAGELGAAAEGADIAKVADLAEGAETANVAELADVGAAAAKDPALSAQITDVEAETAAVDPEVAKILDRIDLEGSKFEPDRVIEPDIGPVTIDDLGLNPPPTPSLAETATVDPEVAKILDRIDLEGSKFEPDRVIGPNIDPVSIDDLGLNPPPTPPPPAAIIEDAAELSTSTELTTAKGAPTVDSAEELPRTPDQEFREFEDFLRQEGATGNFGPAGEPFEMVPYAGARDARQILNLSGDTFQAAHGLPRSVGRGIPGYDPQASLTALEPKNIHTAMDQGWKDAYQALRREGETAATMEDHYKILADSLDASPLPQSLKDAMKLRLQDEIFMEYELGPKDKLPLPYPNIKPRL